MKKLYFVLCLCLLSFLTFGQTEKGYVYLKNGTILKGRYWYSEDLSKISVQSAGNLWIFKADEVDRVQSRQKDKDHVAYDQASLPKWHYRTELGVLAGNSENSQTAPFSITGSGNYAVSPNFSAGLGLGVEFLKETYVPVFANLEYRFRKSQTSPFLFLKTGYQVPVEDSNEIYFDDTPVWSSIPRTGVMSENEFDAKGGFMINPGAGFQQMFSSDFGMTFTVGYQFHRLNYEGENTYSLDIDYHRATLKIGIIFN